MSDTSDSLVPYIRQFRRAVDSSPRETCYLWFTVSVSESESRLKVRNVPLFVSVVKEDDGQEVQRQGDRHSAAVGAEWWEGKQHTFFSLFVHFFFCISKCCCRLLTHTLVIQIGWMSNLTVIH